MRKWDFKPWEILMMFAGSGVFLFALVLYVRQYPIRSLWLGAQEEESHARIGTIIKKTGPIRRLVNGEAEFKSIEVGVPLYNSDTIVTSADSTAVVQLDDGSQIVLAGNSMVKLANEYKLSLGGVYHAPSVNIIVGDVTVQAAKEKITLRSKDKEFSVPVNVAQKIQVIPSLKEQSQVVVAPPLELTPNQPLAKASPSPTPLETPKGQYGYKLELFSPKQDDHVAIPKGSQVAEARLKLQWRMNFTPETPKEMRRGFEAKVAVRKLPTAQDASPSVVFDEKYDNIGELGAADVTLQEPGKYEWYVRLHNENTPSLDQDGKVIFNLDPEFEAIDILQPLIAGLPVTNNAVVGDKLVQDFDMRLRWKPYKKADEFQVRFFQGPSDKTKAILEAKREEPLYIFNKGRVYSGSIYYKISSKLPNGFIVNSPLHAFRFDFQPPAPVEPRNNDSLPLVKRPGQPPERKVIMSWRKTNFTTQYELQVASDPEFKSVIIDKKIQDNFLFFKVYAPGRFYWRVRSYASNGVISPPSEPFALNISP